MTTYSSRFTPVLAADGGFQPLQLTIGAGTVLLSDICAIPDFCNSAWIQVPGPNSLGFRLDGDDTGVDFMTLPPLAFLPLTNRNELLSLVLSAAFGDTAIMIQFFHGSVGPMPPAPEVDDNGGVNPPPPPGSAADWTINVVHVMKNAAGNGGNDATGTRNRLDLPFLTLAAAELVAQAGDEIWVWPGAYTLAAALGKAGVTYRLIDATLSTGGAGPSVFVANGISFNITGNGVIAAGNAANPAISVLGGGRVNAQALSITGAGTALRVQTAGELIVVADVTATSTAAHCSAGTLHITGEVESTAGVAALADNAAAIMMVNGNVVGLTRGAQCTAGNQTITGDASGETIGADCSGGIQEIGGSAMSGAGTGASCSGGQQMIRFNAGSTNATAALCSGGIQEVMGSALSEQSNGASCTGGHQIIRGNAEITDAAANGNAAFCGNDGVQDVYGSVVHVGTGPGININDVDATQRIHGSVTHTGTGFAVSNISGNQLVMGDVTGTSTKAVHVADDPGAITDIRGNILTPEDSACQVTGGAKLILWGRVEGARDFAAVTMTGATSKLVLMSSTYLASIDAGSNVIDGGDGCAVQSNYACGNGAMAGTIVLTIGSVFNTVEEV